MLAKGQLEVEADHLRKDESSLRVQVRHSLIKTAHGEFIVSVMRNITREFKLRMLLHQMPCIVWVTDAELRMIDSLGAGLKATGLEPGHGAALSQYLEEGGFGKEALLAHQKALTVGSASYKMENRKAGKTYYGWAASARDTQGDLFGTIGVAQEATEYLKVK